MPSTTRGLWSEQTRSIGSHAVTRYSHQGFPRSALVIIHPCQAGEGASRAPDQLRCVIHCELSVLVCKTRGQRSKVSSAPT